MTADELPDDVPDSQRLYLNGPVMRFAIRAAGWSNAKFADGIGVHPSSASRMLGGQATTAGVVRRIRAAFPLLELPEIIRVGDLTAALPDGAQDRPVSE